MSLAVVTLWLSALMFGLFGGWLVVAPDKLDEWLGLRATTPEARTELRALYGGLELGIAVFSAYCALSPARHAVGCAGVALFLGGIGAARIYGMITDGTASPQMFAFLGTEILFVILGGIVWMRGTPS